MKNKHAKGPDGQPLIAFNSGRGRGRPKKNSLGSRNLVEPTSAHFFRTIDKLGGPIEPTSGFDEVYSEIFIKKKAKIKETKEEENTNAQEAQSDAEDLLDNEEVNEAKDKAMDEGGIEDREANDP